MSILIIRCKGTTILWNVQILELFFYAEDRFHLSVLRIMSRPQKLAYKRMLDIINTLGKAVCVKKQLAFALHILIKMRMYFRGNCAARRRPKVRQIFIEYRTLTLIPLFNHKRLRRTQDFLLDRCAMRTRSKEQRPNTIRLRETAEKSD